jgi:hypothetical protein
LSLLVTGLAVAGGILIGRILAGGLMKRQDDEPAEPAKPAAGEGEGSVRKSEAEKLEGFPCNLGDVLMRATGEEAWLAGGIVLSEQAPVAVLFVSPDAGGDRAVLVRANPSVEVAWLAPLAEGALTLAHEPPHALELGAARFDRVRRLPLRARRIGTGAPDVGEQVLLAEYASTGTARLVVVVAHGKPRAWKGELLEAGTYDVLPGGRDTLDA